MNNNFFLANFSNIIYYILYYTGGIMDNLEWLLDESIDDELKKKYRTLLKVGNYPLDDDPFWNEEIITDLIPIIVSNYKLSASKTRNLIHIILYNYGFYLSTNDETLNELGLPHLMEEASIKKILARLSNDITLAYFLILNYFRIIADEYLVNMVQESIWTNPISCLSNLDDAFQHDEVFITTKLKDVLFAICEYTMGVDTVYYDEIILNFLLQNRDFFGVIEEYFDSKEQYLAYKPLLVQMLYLDAYYFLDSQKKSRGLSMIEASLLNKIKMYLDAKKINQLPPNDSYFILQLLECFYNINLEKTKFRQECAQSLKRVQKLIKEKANKILLIEYY